MINVYVKIGTKAIAKKMGKVLPQIIHHNHAYVKGRTIFDAARNNRWCHVSYIFEKY